jgi:hypothetical protein
MPKNIYEVRPPVNRGAVASRTDTDPRGPCPTTGSILGYLFNAISGPAREEVEDHVNLCAHCHALVEGARLAAEAFFENDQN